MYVWYSFTGVCVSVSVSSLVYNTTNFKCMCYCLSVSNCLWMLSPALDGLCVDVIEFCLIRCQCNILWYTPVLIVRSIFSPCMCVFLCGWVCMCVWSLIPAVSLPPWRGSKGMKKFPIFDKNLLHNNAEFAIKNAKFCRKFVVMSNFFHLPILLNCKLALTLVFLQGTQV